MPGTDVDDYNDKRFDETHHTVDNAADGFNSAASLTISFAFKSFSNSMMCTSNFIIYHIYNLAPILNGSSIILMYKCIDGLSRISAIHLNLKTSCQVYPLSHS